MTVSFKAEQFSPVFYFICDHFHLCVCFSLSINQIGCNMRRCWPIHWTSGGREKTIENFHIRDCVIKRIEFFHWCWFSKQIDCGDYLFLVVDFFFYHFIVVFFLLKFGSDFRIFFVCIWRMCLIFVIDTKSSSSVSSKCLILLQLESSGSMLCSYHNRKTLRNKFHRCASDGKNSIR